MYNWLNAYKNSGFVTKYAYFRGRPKLTFTFNGSPYFYGSGIFGVHMEPGYSSVNSGNGTPGFKPIRKAQIFQLPHVTVDYSKSETLTLTLPWVSTTDMSITNLTNVLGDTLYTLMFNPFNPITAIDSTAIPNPTILVNIYLELEDIELSYLNVQGPEEMKKDGIISGPIKGVSNLIKKHTPFPMYTTPYTDVADGIAKLLSKVGFGRQPVLDFNLIQRANNFQHTTEDGRTYAPTISNQLKQTKTIGNEELGFGTPNDMMIADICSRWGLVGQLTWSSTQAKGTSLAVIGVHPWKAYFDGVDNCFIPTPLSFIAACFAYARVDMEVKFEIIGTAFHKGVLLVSSIPNTSVVPTMNQLVNESRTAIVDIGNTREIIIPCPHTRNIPYIGSDQNYGGLISGLNSGGADPGKYITNLYVNVMSPLKVGLTANNQAIYINVYMRAVGTPDFQQPTMEWFNKTGGARVGHTQLGRVVIQGPLMSEEGPESDACYCGPGGDCMDLVNYSKASEIHPYVFGESYNSIKQLMNMLSPYLQFYTTAVGTVGVGQTTRFDIPGKPLPPHLNNATRGWSSTLPTMANAQQTFNFQNYLPLAYLAQKGGFIIGLHSQYYTNNLGTSYIPISTNDLTYKVRFARKSNVLSLSNILTNDGLASDSLINDVTGRQVLAFGDSQFFQFKIPDMSNLKFYPASNGTVSYGAGDADANAWYPCASVFIPQTDVGIGTTNTYRNIVVYTAAADDNTLYYFQCAPCIL
jgi:hypothetical protein